MQGPTPVSSLIHSSTLVVVGLILSLRLGYINISISKDVETFMCGASTVSMLAATFIVTSCVDSKRIVAASTSLHVAILTFMLSSRSGVFTFHLAAHANFKVSLFQVVASWMINRSHDQDVRTSRGCGLLSSSLS